jgi:hypothetical protein
VLGKLAFNSSIQSFINVIMASSYVMLHSSNEQIFEPKHLTLHRSAANCRNSAEGLQHSTHNSQNTAYDFQHGNILHGAEPFLRSRQLCSYSRTYQILLNPNVLYHVHKNPPLVPILSQIDAVHTTPSYLYKIHFNIMYPPTSWSP